MEIVKKLRVSSFTSEMALKPRQRRLVGFFDEFKLKTPEEYEEEFNKQKEDVHLREKKETLKGEKGEEFGNLED